MKNMIDTPMPTFIFAETMQAGKPKPIRYLVIGYLDNQPVVVSPHTGNIEYGGIHPADKFIGVSYDGQIVELDIRPPSMGIVKT